MKYITLCVDSEKLGKEKGSIKRVKTKRGYIPALAFLPEGGVVQAYTGLGKPGRNKLIHSGESYNLSAKKGIWRRPFAYLPLTDRNMYVCITAFTLRPLIILLLLLLSLLLLGRCSMQEEKEEFNPKIEVAEEIHKENTKKTDGTIKIKGFTGIRISAATGEGNVMFANPEENRCYFVFSLYTKDNELLYKSDMLPPGRVIRKIKLNKKLPAGEYEGYVHIDTYSVDSGSQMNKANFNISINVK
ncbi:MAG: hypothetical protein K5761_05090 [Clostridiales bacterium]|nr:hypothetical protein [Clostridiales bacterium]